ncbi:NPC intracellular cholesterol transporter 1-like [Ptychodera flava]|uniref:NPC intracellular cholesterol transporter 1-like n=1 Tax=Ptychodera flava TaxID=63121 RepID=UPI00396A8A15
MRHGVSTCHILDYKTPYLSVQCFHDRFSTRCCGSGNLSRSQSLVRWFSPICVKRAHNTCTIHSVLSYYQNNAEHLDRVEYDRSGFWVTADYHDHFLSCVRNPNQTHETKLNMSCVGEFGHAVFPWKVMRGYDDENYNNATALVVTFLMKPPTTSDEKRQLKEWESGFRGLVQNYSSVDNLTLIATTGIKIFNRDMDWPNKEDACVSFVCGKGDGQIEMNKQTEKSDSPRQMNKPSKKSTQKNGKSKDVMQKATMKD